MPNPPAHIDLAHRTALVLKHSTLDDHMGYFLLGSTSPDIRVITKRTREEYHFAGLDFNDVGDGARRLLESNPSLRAEAVRDAPTQAFVAGYITHLIADETWICKLYRPFFGNTDVFEDETLGKVMDRALQLELDRRSWNTVDSTIGLLEAVKDGVDVGFIPSETLHDWRAWVLASLTRGFSWERIRFMAVRIAAGDDSHPAHRLADEFCQSVDESFERLHQQVPRLDLDDYRSEAVESLADALVDYLR